MDNKSMSDMSDMTITSEISDAFDDFMRAFESFKETNDSRLDQIEQKMSSDVVTEDKLGRINQALDHYQQTLDQLTVRSARPAMGGTTDSGRGQTRAQIEHKQAFEKYIRRGDQSGLDRLEEKALSVGSNPDGGYLVPDETETTVMRALRDISPIRSIASVRQVSGSVYKKPFSITGPGHGWVGETAARPETTSPTLAELSFPTMELYAMPAASSSLLDDAAVNIDEWIADEVRTVFAEQEGTAFVTGDGINKPSGFMSAPTVAQSSWSWGNLGYVVTGTSGAFSSTAPQDALIDLIYSVKAGYRANAHFVMSRASQAELRKHKDANGDYLWQPATRPGTLPSLMNVPIVEAEDMPAIAADSFSIAYGDFARGYLIVDRLGIRVLRDPYSNKPYVLFYTTKRVGGGVQDYDAIKLLKFGIA